MTIGALRAEIIEDGIRRVLGWTPSDARALVRKMVDRGSVEMLIEIDDMVPPLRKHRITVDLLVARRGIEAFAIPVGDLAKVINSERDARHWFAVDS